MYEKNRGVRRQTLGEYATPIAKRCTTSIVQPLILANNFEIKLTLLQLVQHDHFRGNPYEESNLHIANFVLLCV